MLPFYDRNKEGEKQLFQDGMKEWTLFIQFNSNSIKNFIDLAIENNIARMAQNKVLLKGLIVFNFIELPLPVSLSFCLSITLPACLPMISCFPSVSHLGIFPFVLSSPDGANRNQTVSSVAPSHNRNKH